MQPVAKLAERLDPGASAGPPLEDALDICLALVELEPHTYQHAAARWVSRLAIERKLPLVDAQFALAALAADASRRHRRPCLVGLLAPRAKYGVEPAVASDDGAYSRSI